MKRFPPSDEYVGIQMDDERKAHWRFNVGKPLEETTYLNSD